LKISFSQKCFAYLNHSAKVRDGRGPLCVVVAICFLMFDAGCSSGPKRYDDPVAVMNAPTTISRSRIKAMRQAAVEDRDNPDRIKGLKEIMMGRGGHPLSVRMEAFEELLDYDAKAAKATLYYRFPTIPSRDLVEALCKRIADEGWVEMTPSLIRSLSTGKPFEDLRERPDGKALLRLHSGKTLNEIVMDEIEEHRPGVLEGRWRMSAWELLHDRLGVPDESLRGWLSDESNFGKGDSFFDALHRGYAELGVIPETVEEVKWLEAIQGEGYSAWWAKCREAVEAIPAANRHDLRLRHLAVLVNVKRFHPDWMSLSREALYSNLVARLDGRRHYFSGIVGQGGGKPMNPQSLEEWEGVLTWADLLTLRLADELTRDESIRDSLFALMAQDRADTATEYGGLLDISPNDGRTEMIEFSPRRVANDTRYHASDEMVERGYTAPFHFHLHVQEKNNRDYAGPGAGDLNYANIMRVNGIVYTSIDKTTLNVDYYEEGKVVVDLGVISGLSTRKGLNQ